MEKAFSLKGTATAKVHKVVDMWKHKSGAGLQGGSPAECAGSVLVWSWYFGVGRVGCFVVFFLKIIGLISSSVL